MEPVQHQVAQQRFIIESQGAEAVLAYRLNDQSIDFYSTYVPPAFRGKGLAEKLVRTGLKWAKEQGYTIQASCWYVAKFIH
jgi:predicted GNAT family acetyltransferase